MAKIKIAPAPLMDNKHVKELLSIMDANSMEETVHLLDLLAYVGEMEKQLGRAVNELQSMRQELSAMREENHPMKTAMQKAVIVMQGQVLDLRDKLAELKAHIIEGCKNAVAAFKERGLSALRGMADYFKLRPGLEALRDDLDKSIKLDDKAIAKIEAVSAEYHEAGRHIKNMGRALVGKEAVTEAKAPGKLAGAIAAPFHADRACLMAMRRCAHAAIGAVARLENAERKPPIMETIQTLNKQIEQAQKDAPLRVRPRLVTHDGR